MSHTSSNFTALLFVIALCIQNSFAQVTQEWVQKYNGTGGSSDAATAMTIDGSGNVYVTGYSTGSGSGHDYTTIKYTSAGVLQWTATYNGIANSHDEALDIAVDNSGNVYVTGRSRVGADEYYTDYATIKYNSAGVQQWVSLFNGTAGGQDVGFAIAIDGQGNVYVTGQSGHPALDSDIGTIKYNSAGVQQWAIEYDATGNWDTGNDITVDGLANVYVTGFHSTNWGTAYLDYVTIKYNSQGVQQWFAGYHGTGNNADEAVAIGLDASGNVYITGFSTGTVYDIATIKYDSTGTQQWVQRYSSASPSIDVPNSLVVDQTGNVYITGAITFDFGTLKYNTNGDLQWISRYDFNGNFDVANSIAIDGSGNSYVTGFSATSSSESTYDYATVKYNPGGIQQWVQRYNGLAGSRDEANDIAIDNSGNVYVTGYVTENTGLEDFGTIKYSQTVGITQISGEIPNTYNLMQNYPNPFNPTTNLRFEISDLRIVKLIVYDILGREVTTLVNEQLKPGTYEVEWDANNYPSGVYYYRLIAGDYKETKKMALIK